jgi:hypothetical protein
MKDKESNVRIKGMLTAALLIAAALLLQIPVFSIDLDYSGSLNSFTGEPTADKRSSVNQDWIPVTSGVYYDLGERNSTVLGSA